MRKVFLTAMMAFLSTALIVACGKDENENKNNENNGGNNNTEEMVSNVQDPWGADDDGASDYELRFGSADGQLVQAGDTVLHLVEDWEVELGSGSINFFIRNLTDATLSTDNEVLLVQGPKRLETSLCAGGSCPWDGQPYNLEPGDNELKPLTVEPHLTGFDNLDAIYKVRVANAGSHDNGITVYLHVKLEHIG